jgi:hypothetical protein
MKYVKFMAVLAFSLTTMAGIARADDFIALCAKYDPTPGSDKVCACASGKISGPDRALAIDAMKAMIAAMASGKPEDAAAITANNAKGLEVIVTAEATCME